jgi:hypothetical protein
VNVFGHKVSMAQPGKATHDLSDLCERQWPVAIGSLALPNERPPVVVVESSSYNRGVPESIKLLLLRLGATTLTEARYVIALPIQLRATLDELPIGASRCLFWLFCHKGFPRVEFFHFHALIGACGKWNSTRFSTGIPGGKSVEKSRFCIAF